MSGLEVAAGVIAVVDLSAKVASLCTQYSRAVITAQSDITRLADHIGRLRHTFDEVTRLLHGQHGARLKASQKLRGGVDASSANLTKIEEKLKVGKGHRAMSRFGWRALSWPFTRKEVDAIIEELRASEAMVALALQVDIVNTAEKIDLDLVLSKLPSAEGAAFDSFYSQHEARCHPQTRVDLLQDVSLWAEDSKGKPVFWLSGMAGTGKSTISRTVAQSFAKNGQLAASFFFKRGEGDRGRANRFFTTLASQMVRSIPRIAPAVRATIEATPDISEKQMKDQFEGLLLQPLMELEPNSPAPDLCVLVIDALDECEDENDVKIILHLLSQARTIRAIRFRVFLTSRPELPIRLGFQHMADDTHQDVKLHEIAKNVIEHDISTFLSDELVKIRTDFSLDADWPGRPAHNELVRTASPLFIFAATISRFIGDPRWHPQDQLELVLKRSPQRQASRLDRTYLPVFDRLLTDCDNSQKMELVEDFRRIVGSIVILEEPLSPESLSKLLSVPRRQVDRRLDILHSVLDVPNDPNQPIRLLHLSFRDFLLDPEKQGTFEFCVAESRAHTLLAKQCLELLGRPGVLGRDICKLDSPGTLRSEVSDLAIRQHLPAEVQYACRYWIDHLTRSNSDDFWERSYAFFSDCFLYWLEAMSLMGRVLDSLDAIKALQKMVSDGGKLEFANLLVDAKRFIITFRSAIEAAPLQIYCSGLVFAPEKSLVRKKHQSKMMPSWKNNISWVPEDWSAALTLEGHRDWVISVAFSPDSKRVVSGSIDGTIKLWGAETGMLQTTLEDNDEVSSLAFSPDGKWVASGLFNGGVKLWDVESGTIQWIFEGHTGIVYSVIFSPDGKRVASSSEDTTVKLWDALSGTLQSTLEDRGEVWSVAFSPDSKQVASSSSEAVKLYDAESGTLLSKFEDSRGLHSSVTFPRNGKRVAMAFGPANSVGLWDVESGKLQLTVLVPQLARHRYFYNPVAFSLDGKWIASLTAGYLVRIWDVESGTLQSTLRSHDRFVGGAAFSPDGKRVASTSLSTSDDHYVKIWDVELSTPQSMRTGLESYQSFGRSIESVAFSLDGKRVVSSSRDTTVRLWDVESGRPQYLWTLKGHSGLVCSVAFSPDGKQVASSSYDGTVKLWDSGSGTLQLTLTGHSNIVIPSVALSADGKRLVSGSYDETVKLWDTESGALQLTLQESNAVKSVAFSPDGKQVASGSHDRTIKLWDAESGRLLSTQESGSLVCRLSFSADGSRLYTDVGTFALCPGALQKVEEQPGLLVSDQWIMLGSQRLTWLPPEHRGTCFAVNGQSLVLGHSSGLISHFQFDLSRMGLSKW